MDVCECTLMESLGGDMHLEQMRARHTSPEGAKHRGESMVFPRASELSTVQCRVNYCVTEDLYGIISRKLALWNVIFNTISSH